MVLRFQPVGAHVIYKGMLMSGQVEKYYPDLRDADDDDGAGAGAFAVFHEYISELGSRASESLHRAQRRNQHVARQRKLDARGAGEFQIEIFGDDIKKIIPVINTDGSDSAQFDNCVELLMMAGRELPHAMMMMIPEPWENHESMDAGTPRVLRISFVPDGAVGRPGFDGVHGRKNASVRASTEMVCGRRAITSRKTTSSSWRRRQGFCRSLLNVFCKKAV